MWASSHDANFLPWIPERNLAEFASKDFDWRFACPEDEMYPYTDICNNNRELIHPVHFELGEYKFDTGGRVIKVGE